MLRVPGMTALLSALLGLATILGVWCALSVLSVPILVLAVRSQGRANARRAAALRRDAWSRSAR